MDEAARWMNSGALENRFENQTALKAITWGIDEIFGHLAGKEIDLAETRSKCRSLLKAEAVRRRVRLDAVRTLLRDLEPRPIDPVKHIEHAVVFRPGLGSHAK